MQRVVHFEIYTDDPEAVSMASAAADALQL
jgi:hypothetical protein